MALSRFGLQLVHRGLRHARPERGQGVARSAARLTTNVRPSKILITPSALYLTERNAFGFRPGPSKHERKPRHAALPALREAYAVHAITSEAGRASGAADLRVSELPNRYDHGSASQKFGASATLPRQPAPIITEALPECTRPAAWRRTSASCLELPHRPLPSSSSGTGAALTLMTVR